MAHNKNTGNPRSGKGSGEQAAPISENQQIGQNKKGKQTSK